MVERCSYEEGGGIGIGITRYNFGLVDPCQSLKGARDYLIRVLVHAMSVNSPATLYT